MTMTKLWISVTENSKKYSINCQLPETASVHAKVNNTMRGYFESYFDGETALVAFVLRATTKKRSATFEEKSASG